MLNQDQLSDLIILTEKLQQIVDLAEVSLDLTKQIVDELLPPF